MRMRKTALVALVLILGILNFSPKAATNDANHLRELAQAASKISGYPMPSRVSLMVMIVEPEVISAIACAGQPYCPVLGLYQDQNVIFVVSGYSPLDTDVVILHEMIHWLQHNSGEWATVTEATPAERYIREIEAHSSDQEYMINYQHRCRADNASELGDFCPRPVGVIGPPAITRGAP